MALYAKEIEEEKSLRREGDIQALEEVVLKAESIQREVAKLRESIEREYTKREKEWDAKMAMVEAKAWDEVSGLDEWNAHHHKVGLNTRETDNAGSKEMIYLPRSEIDVPQGKLNGHDEGVSYPHSKFHEGISKSNGFPPGRRVEPIHVDEDIMSARKYIERQRSESERRSALPDGMNSRNPAVITRHASDSGVRFDEPETRGQRNGLFRSGPVKVMWSLVTFLCSTIK